MNKSIRFSNAFAKVATLTLFALLVGGSFYWFLAVRPFLHVKKARLAALYLEVRSDLSGRLTFAPHHEGDSIQKGEVLFSLSSFEEKQRQKQMQMHVESLEKMISYYSAAVELATKEYITARRDADLGECSEDFAQQSLVALQEQQRQVNECRQQLAAAQANLAEANQSVMQKSIDAPFSGVIIKRQKREGDLLAFGDTVYSLCDPTQVWVDAIVSEKQIAKIAVGQKAFVSLAGNKNHQWEGAVSWISPAALPSKRGVEVRISLIKQDNNLLLPNLSADVKIKVQ